MKIEQELRKKIMQECYYCKNRRDVPGNCHIKCVKPDVNMTGNEHGKKNGWFMYPLLFDPTWKTKQCDNFELHESVNLSVSGAVEDEKNG